MHTRTKGLMLLMGNTFSFGLCLHELS